MIRTHCRWTNTNQRDRASSDLHRDLLFFGRSWRRGAVCYGGSLSFSVYEFRGFRRNVLFNNCTINRFGLGELPSQAF
jgi:hypothetical protein